MSEYPILFSTEMVKAILGGKKTQTRRVVSNHNSHSNKKFDLLDFNSKSVRSDNGGDHNFFFPFPNAQYLHVPTKGYDDDPKAGEIWRVRPRMVPGDRLWVREAFVYDAIGEMHESEDRTESIQTILGHGVHLKFDTEMQMQEVTYRADESDPDAWNWKPSIFMPRWASRITLEITNIRVERVQEISGDDCFAEGVELPKTELWPYVNTPNKIRCVYENLWDSINGKRKGCSWEENPYVWAITFKVIR